MQGMLTLKDAIDNKFYNCYHMQFSKKITNFKQGLTTLVKQQETFTSTTSLLFGKEFDRQAKKHLDTVKKSLEEQETQFKGTIGTYCIS